MVAMFASKREQCREELRTVRAKYGYSVFADANKDLNRERIQATPGTRPNRKRWKPSEYKRKYHEQHGMCAICEAPMIAPHNWPGDLDMDHKDPNRTEGFNDWQNMQLSHRACNQSKGGKSMMEQSKSTGATILQLQSGGQQQ